MIINRDKNKAGKRGGREGIGEQVQKEEGGKTTMADFALSRGNSKGYSWPKSLI